MNYFNYVDGTWPNFLNFSMNFSILRILSWKARFEKVQELLDEIWACQRCWIYLDDVLSVVENSKKIAEVAAFQQVDSNWKAPKCRHFSFGHWKTYWNTYFHIFPHISTYFNIFQHLDRFCHDENSSRSSITFYVSIPDHHIPLSLQPKTCHLNLSVCNLGFPTFWDANWEIPQFFSIQQIANHIRTTSQRSGTARCGSGLAATPTAASQHRGDRFGSTELSEFSTAPWGAKCWWPRSLKISHFKCWWTDESMDNIWKIYGYGCWAHVWKQQQQVFC